MSAVIISVAGVVVAVAALVAALWQGYLLRRQVAHAEQVSNAQFYQNITIQWIEFDKIFIERPHLWSYFHGGKPVIEDGGDHADLISVATAIANLAEMCVNCQVVLGSYSGDWERYFRFVYLNSPFFREFWGKHSSMWSNAVDRAFVTPVSGIEPSTPPEVAVDCVPA
ncbi:hypothetical protein Val02_18960 [Virgisporangium aliadipatigenens]|uniref:Uncharacterized protein n=1 Tax=Virgisporangium aliadipatigenens TaxID=741659 RepID=A0A8J4DNL0_9ACTN|nr:hypothetical protein [Virgisporangium aliadipatigenens]GIJ45010.1 hypothetical protein Val02_18960 [Virgisporangium aliadipatigenens]